MLRRGGGEPLDVHGAYCASLPYTLGLGGWSYGTFSIPGSIWTCVHAGTDGIRLTGSPGVTELVHELHLLIQYLAQPGHLGTGKHGQHSVLLDARGEMAQDQTQLAGDGEAKLQFVLVRYFHLDPIGGVSLGLIEVGWEGFVLVGSHAVACAQPTG